MIISKRTVNRPIKQNSIRCVTPGDNFRHTNNVYQRIEEQQLQDGSFINCMRVADGAICYIDYNEIVDLVTVYAEWDYRYEDCN